MTDTSSLAPRYASPAPSPASPGATAGRVPWWATPWGVALVLSLWVLIHFYIAAAQEGAVNVDDAIESYLVQSFKVSYVARNPALYDWMLYALQQVVGTGTTSFALLRYGLLLACALLVYQVARRVIGDPRLQALAVYSLSAIWVIGYHSHRILTHSNAMIVAVAGAFLTLIALSRRPSLPLYAGFGVWIAWGVLGKFGFVAFLVAVLIAGLLEPSFRRALLDPRILVSLAVAAVPVGLYAFALHAENQDAVAATANVIATGRRGSIVEVLNAFGSAWVGYLLPFIALAGLVFLPGNRGEDPGRDAPERAAPRRVLRTMLVLGTIGTLIAVLVTGNVTLRDRYFHVFFLLAPVYVFAELELLGGWRPRAPIYLGVLAALAVGIVGVRVVVLAWPDPRLCGRCVAAEPLFKIAPVVYEHLGDRPTLVADDRVAAGRLRAAVPDARVVTMGDPEYRPPSRPATGCGRVTGISNGFNRPTVPPADRTSVEMAVKWASPWMNPHRYSDWQITPLSLDDPLCR